jgi:micrococcal nuclease
MQYRIVLLTYCCLLCYVYFRVVIAASAKYSPKTNNLYRRRHPHTGVPSYFRQLMNFFTKPVQFENAGDIPSEYFREKRIIEGKVLKIVDGDTFRVRHLGKEHFDGPMNEHTLSIRLAAVDTPEKAKNGNSGQEYADEAASFAERKLLNKKVQIKLLSRDQYGRVVARVMYKERLFIFQRSYDIGEQLLRKGLAVVYRQGGAQYDGSMKHWTDLEEIAIRKRKRIWKNGLDQAKLPSDYKKKQRESKELAVVP